MWSKNPTPVEMEDCPVPSRLSSRAMSVSLVLRAMEAVRKCGPFNREKP